MNFYDATAKEGWSPVGYTPVEVPELASHMTEMQMITQMVETATAATAIEKGDTPEGADTLGEINLLVAKADDRLKDVPKFARMNAKQLGHKLAALIEANTDTLKPVTLYKKGVSGNYFEKTINPKILRAPKGYNCVVSLKTEKEADSLKAIQKLKIGAAQFPANIPLQEILSDRMLSWLDLNPDEKQRVKEFQQQNPTSLLPQQTGAPITPGGPVAPQNQPLANAPAVA